MRIVAISGSLRKDSFNTKLLRAMQALAPEGIEIDIVDVQDVPVFNDDVVAEYPSSAQAVRDAVEGADAIIFAVPEYNRQPSPVITNVLAWLTRPYPHNSLKGKPVLVSGVSSGKLGTAPAQLSLKHTLLYLEAEVLGQPELYLGPAKELFDASGELQDSTAEFVKKALDALVARAA